MASFAYQRGIAGILNGDIDLLTNNIRIALVTSSYVANKDDDFWSTPAAYELSGTGYTAGGELLGSKTVTIDDANDWVEFDCADPTWTAINAGTADAAVVYRDTGVAATSELILYIDDGGFPITTNGGDLTITVNASGLFYIG